MGGKSGGAGPPGGSAITWGPLARDNGWGWDPPRPDVTADRAGRLMTALENDPTAVSGPLDWSHATPSEPAAAAAPAQGSGDTAGSIDTTPDAPLGSQMAQSIAPSMWQDQLKTQTAGGAGSMNVSGQV